MGLINSDCYYYEAELAGCRESDNFLISFWVRAHIAVNNVVIAPRHNMIDWANLLFSVSG